MEGSSSDSDSEGGLFNINPFGVYEKEDEEERKKKEETKAKKRKDLNPVYHNCYFSQETKQQKAEHKIEKVRKKRKRMRENRKRRRRKFLESMTKEERAKYAEDMKKKEFEIEEKLQKGLKEGIIVCIDCGFEDEMSIKENKSLAQQLNFVYGRIRASEIPYNLHVINFKGMIKELAEKRLMTKWKVTFEPRSLLNLIEDDAFDGRDVVYLSPDAEEELEHFDKETIYVIGGLVDASVSLLHTKKKARDLGIKSYKLPMNQFREKYPFRACLNINHIFDIIDSYHNHGDMYKAIEDNLPQRFKTGRNRQSRRLLKEEREKQMAEEANVEVQEN